MKNMRSVLSLVLALVLAFGALTVSFAGSTAETEPNNEREEASVYDIEDVATGSLDAPEDIDWYKLSATKPGLARLKFSQQGNDSFDITVYGDEENELASFTASGSESVSPYFTVNKGDYYIKVEAGDVVSGSEYTLDFESDVTYAAEDELNDVISEANEVKLSGGVSTKTAGTLNADDTDWFIFKGIKGYFYVELTKLDGGSGIITAECFTVKSKTVGSVSVTVKDKPERTADVGCGATDYYIRITGEGVYSFVVTAQADSLYETESNDTTATASVYKIDAKDHNERMYGTISFEGDVDYYKINTDDGSVRTMIKVSAFDAANYAEFNADSAWQVYLIDTDGNETSAGTATVSSPVEVNLAEKEAGTCYIKVTGDLKSTKSAYKITSSYQEPPEPEKPFFLRLLGLFKGSKIVDDLKELFGNMDNFQVIFDLLRTSVGTIILWIFGAAKK